ncbi:MAG: hypothetical protein RLY70_2117 [Planctomycetota bacterium]|jgi:hypothetical protein
MDASHSQSVRGIERVFLARQEGAPPSQGIHSGFVWVPPKIRASPNFLATAQAALCDSCDGQPQETQQDFQRPGHRRAIGAERG